MAKNIPESTSSDRQGDVTSAFTRNAECGGLVRGNPAPSGTSPCSGEVTRARWPLNVAVPGDGRSPSLVVWKRKKDGAVRRPCARSKQFFRGSGELPAGAVIALDVG